MDSAKLTNKLISIPSFVDDTNNEIQIGNFIYDYLSGLPWLTVKKQQVKNGRFNVYAKDKGRLSILLNGHMDTVLPQSGWKTNPLKAINKNGIIYGLGASDMKGSLASLLSAIKKAGPTNGCGYLFYIDEEYEFLGMKKFISEYKGTIKPQFIISGDGSDLKFGTACRGLIEVKFIVEGRSGHAANPRSGNNAILAVNKSLLQLQKTLKTYQSKQLGSTSLNVAYLKGGLCPTKITKEKNQIKIQANMIANYCEILIDIRPANITLDAEKVVKVFSNFIKENKCKVVSKEINHDYGSWQTDKKAVRKFTKIIKSPKYTMAKNRGYIDTQMLWKSFNYAPALTFGPGNNKLAHQPNEYVTIDSLKQTENFFTKLISMYNLKR